jgi:superfamily II DNA or RNA helicase
VDDETLLCALSLYTRRAGSTFTSNNQKRLLEAVLTGEHESVLAVLPTGSGKSIAIFGPPLVESEGITLVITCYSALRCQLAEQAQSFGIKHLVWHKNAPGSLDPSVRLVIMITDDIFQEEGKKWVHLICCLRQVLT